MISLLCLAGMSQAWAAEDAKQEKTPVYGGLFLDVDVVEPAVSLFSDEHKGANASVSVDLLHRFLPSVTVGYASYDASSDYSGYIPQGDGYEYKVDGPYFKVGVDFNMLQSKNKTKKYKPAGYVGFRFAFSPFDYEIKNARYEQLSWNREFGYSVSGSSFTRWWEFVGGIKVPVYKRLYLSLEGNYKLGVKTKHESHSIGNGQQLSVNNTYAPGLGDSKGSGWGFRYMISFLF